MRAAVVVFVCLLSVTLSAQWAPFVRSEVPKTADGRPNLDAPPPRLPNGTIDFSGTWESRIPPSGRLGGPMVPNAGDAPPLAAFVNIGQNMKDGLPLTPWVNWRLGADEELIEFVCNENEQDAKRLR